MVKWGRVMKSLLFATSVVLGLAAAQPASAADLEMPTKAPVVAPFYNWNGFYIGGNVGAGTSHTDYNSYLSTGALEFTGNYDSSGFFGGGQIGFNYLVTPQWLIGIEADADWSSISGTSYGCTATGCSSGQTSINDFGTVRGRVGYVSGNFLLYGTGGWAWSESGTNRTINCVGATCATGGTGVASPLVGMAASSSGTQGGWAAGAGIEYGILPNLTIRAQFLHLEFDNIGRSFTYAGFPTAFRSTLANTGSETFTFGVNYLLNWAPAPSAFRH